MFNNQFNQKFWLEDQHFLKIDKGKLIFWNYKSHEQFEITPTHTSRLIEFSKGSVLKNTSLDSEIFNADVLVKDKQKSHWGWDWLAHIYHYGTCHPSPPEFRGPDKATSEHAKSYIDYCASIAHNEPEIDVIKGGAIFNLPRPNIDSFKSTSLWDTLSHRRTCRDFDGSSAELSDLSDILFATFGDQCSPDPTTPLNAKVHGYRRTSPSTGGLQCTEPYLWAININDLPPGIYHYLSRRHQLENILQGNAKYPIGTYLCNQNWANDMAFAIIMTCRMDKLWWKYPHSRAYRPMLMDVGHLSQTLNMCITAKGLHPWITGYFHDKDISELLSCPHEKEEPMLIVGAGSGSGSSFSRESRNEFNKIQIS